MQVEDGLNSTAISYVSVLKHNKVRWEQKPGIVTHKLLFDSDFNSEIGIILLFSSISFFFFFFGVIKGKGFMLMLKRYR